RFIDERHRRLTGTTPEPEKVVEPGRPRLARLPALWRQGGPITASPGADPPLQGADAERALTARASVVAGSPHMLGQLPGLECCQKQPSARIVALRLDP